MCGTLRRRLGAWILLATFAVLLGSSQVSANHFGLVDTACGDVALARHDAARVGVAVNVPAEHCPVCHFLRAVSSAAVAAVVSVGVPESEALLGAAPSTAPAETAAPTLSSRGPPSTIRSDVRFS